MAAYDGRATAGENWEERTGVARGVRLPDGSFGALTAEDREPRGQPARPERPALPEHGRPCRTARQRIYYEATRADGAHDLRTELA